MAPKITPAMTTGSVMSNTKILSVAAQPADASGLELARSSVLSEQVATFSLNAASREKLSHAVGMTKSSRRQESF